MSELLDVQQRQIVDLQERVTSLERTPAGERPAGGGLDVVPLIVKLVGAVARAAADAAGQGGQVPPPPKGSDTVSVGPMPASKLGESIRRAQAAADGATRQGTFARWIAEQQAKAEAEADEHRDHVHRRLTPEEAAAVPPRPPMFPIEQPESAAPFAGRTAPRRTRPPEAPLRLWNREHTDHFDAVGRAVPTPGKTRVRIRDDQVDTVRAWLAPLIEPDDCGPVYVVWMDREWTLAGYASEYGAEYQSIKLDLLPLPKPPRVDEALGRSGGHGVIPPFRGKTTPPAGAPYATPIDLAKGDRIGVEHPDTGEVTIHEFSGDPAHPVADEKPTALFQPKAQPEFVGTVTSGLIHTTPEHVRYSDGACMGHCPAPPPHGTDVDEVLPMPGGPNDRLSHAVSGDMDEGLCVAKSPERPHFVCSLPLRHGGDHIAQIESGHTLARWPQALHFQTGKPFTGYADLYARLDDIHDAVDQGDEQ